MLHVHSNYNLLTNIAIMYNVSELQLTINNIIVQWCFKCLPEDRAKADAVLELKFKNMVPKILSEEKRAVTKKLYKDGNV